MHPSYFAGRLGRALFCVALLSSPLCTHAEPMLLIDDMEDLSQWRTGGQKEAALVAETATVSEGKQALRLDVKIDHQADESVGGEKYPKGWPRVERNPEPPLDLSAVGGIAFDIYTTSSTRTAMPGSSLHIILRNEGEGAWSSNLGQLPLEQWKSFRLDFTNFPRDRVVHWQFFLSESDYADGDEVGFIIDNVRGYAAQRSRQLVPQLVSRLRGLEALTGEAPPADLAPRLAAVRQAVADAEARLALLDELDFPASNALDARCAAVLRDIGELALTLGARETVPDGSYCVGVETSLRKVFRDDTDIPAGRALELAVAGNEREAAQILVHPLTADIPRLAAECSRLIGPEGVTLPAGSVELHAVGYVEMLPTGYSTERGGWWPDPLIPLDWPGSGKRGLGPLADVFARAGETQPLWVTVRCPADAAPGLYRGEITLRPEGLPESTVSLQVRVRDFSLPLRPRLKTAFSFFEQLVTQFAGLPSLTQEQRRACETFLLERKTNPMLLYNAFAWPGLQDVEFMGERGLNAYCLGYVPSTVAAFGNEVYYRWLRDQRDWLARHGLDRDAWVYGYDEPHCSPDFETLKGIMRQVYGMTEEVAPGMPRGSTTAIIPELYGAVNLWVPQTMQVVRQDTVARQEAGDQVWTYVACTPAHPFANIFVDYPALEHRLLFWQTWQERCTGFLYYATNLWRANCEGQEERWPQVPWNPRPVKDFAFNGDGILLYPGPDATLLSSVRQEIITDGIEDYDYLCLLRDAALELQRRVPEQGDLAQEALAATAVPEELSASLTRYSSDPAVLLARREVVADMLRRVRRALPEEAWRRVLLTEPPLSPEAPRIDDTVASVPFTCDFEAEGGMTAWVSRSTEGAAAQIEAVPGMGGEACAVSRTQAAGWADWESPYLPVTVGTQCVVRLSAQCQGTARAPRVFLFRYDEDRMPLDLPIRGRESFSPALLGEIDGGGDWQRRRFIKQIEPGVAFVRLYLQSYGIEGRAAFDDVLLTLGEPEPGLVDDCDDVGQWKTGFPEASVIRESVIVHQGAAALRFRVVVDHKGGEAAHPVGWPHLRLQPSPPLDWRDKRALTFWVYAETTRENLPQQAVIFAVKSADGDGLSMPLTFPKGSWQQVTVDLTGKRLPAVNHLEFFVSESAYEDGDEVSFIIDDIRVTQ